MTTTYGSRKLHKDKKLDLMLMEDSDPEDSDPEDMKAIKGEGEFRKVKRMPGMYYKVIFTITEARPPVQSVAFLTANHMTWNVSKGYKTPT